MIETPAAPYRVLARKYRPRSFDDLIGQGAMVRTLSNAFESGRIPQAWMLTGVRGVGKTTTARILARALNYEPEGGGGKPTVSMPDEGVHCSAIMESRHVDVMEMDAASHTGIDDVRQIIDGIRYAPVSARYKVYIIDEVHMLSEKAFNAFLKTLEEPPPHARFVFATTEIRKVPVTILSRCQRFDLRRVDAETLMKHLAGICAAEAVTVEDEALALIARAAEGSVRDSLSLLDQAIAHGAGHVGGEGVRDMLGLADRARVPDLFEMIMRGDIAPALAEFTSQYNSGADPAIILNDLASFTHLVTRLKLTPEAGKDASLTDVERKRGAEFAAQLSVRVLSRAWQILLKGVSEVQASARPAAAAEMVLVRLAYAADLPTPDDALRSMRENGGSGNGGAAGRSNGQGGGSSGTAMAVPARSAAGGGGQAVRAMAAPQVMSNPGPVTAVAAPAAQAGQEFVKLSRFEDIVALAGERREVGLKAALERDVRLVRFEQGQIEFALAEGGNSGLAAQLSRQLQEWTGQRWIVALSSAEGAPTLAEVARERAEERRNDAQAHPVVKALLSRFPGAIVTAVRDKQPEPVEDMPEHGETAETAFMDWDDTADFDD